GGIVARGGRGWLGGWGRAGGRGPAVGMGAGRRDFERRLTMILREQVPCRLPLRGLLGVGLLALIVLPTWSAGQQPYRTETVPGTQTQRYTTEGRGPDGQTTEVTETRQPSYPAPGDDRDRRLQALEKQLQDLLKEVQSLRSGGKAATAPPAGPAPDVWRGAFTVQQRSVATPDKDGVQEVTLT